MKDEKKQEKPEEVKPKVELDIRGLVQERINKLDAKEVNGLDLNTALLYLACVPKKQPLPEEVKEPTEKELLEEELKVLETNLKDNKVRVNGGLNQATGRMMMPIDMELNLAKRTIEKINLMNQYDAPARPVYAFETQDRFREILREENKEKLELIVDTVKRLEEQKTNAVKELPEIQKRINEVEKELKIELTKFEKETTDPK